MRLLAPALIFCGAVASFGQSPQVPHKMQFAGMTLTIRDDARREIQANVDALTKSPKYFNIKAERARTYFPIIEEVFAQERLPVDFKYLALQESALVPDAVSTSNAVGFWQFKEPTAIEMGMRVDNQVDERMNIASSSRAAARYLKQCNHYFNNWVYALQAYQMGAGGVMRAVGDKDLGTRHMDITSDTYWYVKKFIAHRVAFEDVTGRPSLEVTALRGVGGKTLAELSREYSLGQEQLQEFNKWLRTDRIPEDKEYVFLVPKGDAVQGFGLLTVTTAANTLPEAPLPSAGAEFNEINGIKVIRAKAGETLSALVARADISMSRFLNYNEMDIEKPIQGGSWYFLGKKKKHAEQEIYSVQRGEDLWTVSQRFGVRMKNLLKYNDLGSEKANLGAVLYLSYHRPASAVATPDSAVVGLETGELFEWDISLSPTGNVSSSPQKVADSDTTEEVGASPTLTANAAQRPAFHEVKPSDTLYGVARLYGITIREIMEWNGKKDFNLAVGEKLRVTAR